MTLTRVNAQVRGTFQLSGRIRQISPRNLNNWEEEYGGWKPGCDRLTVFCTVADRSVESGRPAGFVSAGLKPFGDLGGVEADEVAPL